MEPLIDDGIVVDANALAGPLKRIHVAKTKSAPNGLDAIIVIASTNAGVLEKLRLHVAFAEDFDFNVLMFFYNFVQRTPCSCCRVSRASENPFEAGSFLKSLFKRVLDLSDLPRGKSIGEELELEDDCRVIESANIGINSLITSAPVHSVEADILLLEQEIAEVFPALRV